MTRLTARQAEVLKLAASGLSGKQIARYLGISGRTVEDHFSRMRQRTGARSDGELVAYGVTAGIVAPGTAPPACQAGRHGTGEQATGQPGPQRSARKRPFSGAPGPTGQDGASSHRLLSAKPACGCPQTRIMRRLGQVRASMPGRVRNPSQNQPGSHLILRWLMRQSGP